MVSLAVTYFRTGSPHYHRRCVVSRPCSGWEGVGPTRYGRQAIRGSRLEGPRVGRPPQARRIRKKSLGYGLQPPANPDVRGYRIKPHGQLVPVSSSDCSPSTSGLSTSWSRTTLEGDHLYAHGGVHRSRPATFPECALIASRPVSITGLGHQASGCAATDMRIKVVSGKSHLGACFALRCFQRLSLPHVATRRYDWRHNRYTSGASTPVLSY